MAEIRVENLTVEYRNRKTKETVTAVSGFSHTFPDGSFTVILGASGCGKTTLLRSVAGLIDDYEGNIYFNDINSDGITVKERNCAYVSQNYSLYPKMNVFDNIAFPLKMKKIDSATIKEKVYETADFFEIRHCLSRKPKYLSGGQQQRVAIARSLVKGADLFLFDEPLSNIDPEQRNEERRIIKKTVTSCGGTAIYVTHDVGEAFAIADRIIIMDEGKIIESGTPEEIVKNSSPIIKAYLDSIESGSGRE